MAPRDVENGGVGTEHRRAALKAAASEASRSGARKAMAGDPQAALAGSAQPIAWIIYAREEEECAHALLKRLRADGIDARWDRDLPPGAEYDDLIEQAIKDCDAAVPIWSEAAVASRYVRDEAVLALELDKLVPVHVAGYDVARLPFRLRRTQSTCLDRYDLLLAAVRRRCKT